ncbi:MAG TPA: hypothetical protein VFZ25_03910 [Chloroflexota bacterium]|nr:hypothetical protein [Chloroflexota bacterium]
MSGHRAVQTIRDIARFELEQRWTTALGIVKSVHGNDGTEKRYACTVELRDTRIVLPKVPIATGLIGTAALPREKDLVVVVFVGGDLHEAVIVGRLYTDDVDPPENGSGDLVAVLPGDEVSSEKRIEFKVATPGDGTRDITLSLDGPVKVFLEIKDDGVTIQTTDASIKLSQSSASDGQAEIKVGGSKITLTQSGDVTVEAIGTLKLHGSQVEIDGDASVKIAGTTIDLN